MAVRSVFFCLLICALSAFTPCAADGQTQQQWDPNQDFLSLAFPEEELEKVGYSTIDLLPDEATAGVPPKKSGRPPGSLFSTAFDTRWEPASGGIEVQEFSGMLRVYLPPIFGPPPPSISLNGGLTRLDGISVGNLYTLSVGVNWIRPVNDRWTWMFGITPSIATDWENTSGDMWRIRGNAFAFYSPRDDLQWIFGAVVTGRSDLPALPAIGLIWWPDDQSKLELTFPRPRYSRLIGLSADQETWGYLGAELGGGTWAVELPGGVEDELTYRAWRIVLGMEFVSPGAKRPGARGSGSSGYVEAGVSLGREIEFERTPGTLSPTEAFYIGGGVRF